MNNRQNTISIVTPSYNQGQYIEETICSVLDQNYTALEYIIIDGGSNDNSIEIIKKYEKHLKYWVSEKDNGQVSAINKGLAHCTGEIFNWLNSDDYLNSGALHKIAAAFTDKRVDLVAGSVNNFSKNECEIINNQNLSAGKLMCWMPGTHFVQPGVWMRRQHFINSGGIDEKFNFAFDWDMMIRYLFDFSNVVYLDDVLVNFRLHDTSKTVQWGNNFAMEEVKIIEKLAGMKRYEELHKYCKFKLNRSAWVTYLDNTVKNPSLSAVKKITSIISKINKQPKNWGVTRMTLGALKNILFHKTDPEPDGNFIS